MPRPYGEALMMAALQSASCARVCGVWAIAALAWLPSQPRPVTVTQIGAIPGPADVVELDGRRAYVGAGSTLRIIDITNPTAPTQTGALTLPQRIWGLAIAGPLVYVANDLNGLVVVDASDPARPTMRGAFKTPGQAVGVAASAHKAVIANLMSGVQVVDVTDADKLTSLGSYFTEGYARDVTTSGSLAFAIDQPTGFSVLDVSKAGAPTELSAQQSAAQAPIVVAASPAAAGAQGPRVVCVLSNAGAQGTLLQVFDVSNPTSPAKVGSLKTPGRAQRLVLSGDRALIADGPEGLQVVDISSPSSPSVVASFKTTGQARDVAASGSTILMVVGGTAPNLSGTAVTNSTSENTSIVILRLEP